MYLESVWGLAKTHQTGLGFVHAHHSDPSKKLGQPVALRLVEKVADRCDVTLETILNKLHGICISCAIKDGMVLIFNMNSSVMPFGILLPTLSCVQPRVRQGLQKSGGSPLSGSDAEGLCPLILCNVLHNVLVNS